jgi:FMN phosphatase YigB (HAD superfamily)
MPVIRMDLTQKNCIMVGDKVEKDIIGANEIGMKTIWYNYKKVEQDHNADWMIHGFNEMINQIEEIIK